MGSVFRADLGGYGVPRCIFSDSRKPFLWISVVHHLVASDSSPKMIFHSLSAL